MNRLKTLFFLFFIFLFSLLKAQNYVFDQYVEQQYTYLSGDRKGKSLPAIYLINSSDLSYKIQILKSATEEAYSAILTDRKNGYFHYFNAEIQESADLKIGLNYVESRKLRTGNSPSFKKVTVAKTSENVLHIQAFTTKNSRKPSLDAVAEIEERDEDLLIFSHHEISYANEKYIADAIRKLFPDKGAKIRKYKTRDQGLFQGETIINSTHPVKLNIKIDKIKIIK